MPFSTLGLSPALLRALSAKAYATPTAVQAAAIPAALQGRDILSCAQTGSGKTAAFAIPILQLLEANSTSRSRNPSALVLVPTRELAMQVGEVFRELAQHLPVHIKVTVAYGGVSINPQMMGLRGGSDIVVATPGRLLDLLEHNALKLNDVTTLALDEADRLLDMGFADELQRILKTLPTQRQNLFFSATFPADVTTLANTLLHDPVKIEVQPTMQSQPDIKQRAIAVDTDKRTQLLRHLITQHDWSRVLVFVATKYATELVSLKLRKAGITAEPFYGELSQGKRTQVLADFKASRVKVVVATDVASRGIDIEHLPVVVNYDLPRSADDYTHRIGRTGRAGASGIAVSFISASNQAHWRLIEKRQQQRLTLEHIAGFEPTETAPPTTATNNGGIKGKRPSKKDKLRAARGE